jgi:capsular polysaccharide transport system ATP-binding protein
MIEFNNVSKTYHGRNFEKRVLRDVSFTLSRGTTMGICGGNGAGKSTLLRLIAGVEHPTSGRIQRNGTVSWPIGYSSAFQSSLTGADNARFVARIHRKPIDATLEFVNDFAELGRYFHMPVKTYSAGMSARLAFAISLSIDFDCYLVDEVVAAGDARFRQRCHDALLGHLKSGSLVMVSHDTTTLREYCSTGAMLHDGRLARFDTVDEAIDAHFALQMAPT